MSDTKEYIKGDKHVHQAGSIMIKFAQYNVPERKGDWKQQEEKEAEELEKEFADFEEVVEETVENNESKVNVKPDLPPADVFVNRVKAIVMEAANKNGETITVNAKGWSGQYTFYVDADRISKMLDDLRQNSEQKVKEYLDLFKGCTSVSAVAPFVGEILDIEELRVKELQKSDMKFAFEPFYGKSATAVSKLSSKVGNTESEMLINTFKGLLRKYP